MGCPIGQPFISMELLSLGSAYGTSVCTSTAINALFRVDNVDSITLSDSLAGALVSACTACYAIFRNLVCHFLVPPIFLIDILYHTFTVLKSPFLKKVRYFQKKFSKTAKVRTKISFRRLRRRIFCLNVRLPARCRGDKPWEHRPRPQA